MQLENVNSEVNAIPYDGTVGPQEPVDWWTDIEVPGQGQVRFSMLSHTCVECGGAIFGGLARFVVPNESRIFRTDDNLV